jgi:hypothetical protein
VFSLVTSALLIRINLAVSIFYIHCIDIADNDFGAEGLRLLMPAISKLKQLTSLYLGGACSACVFSRIIRGSFKNIAHSSLNAIIMTQVTETCIQCSRGNIGWSFTPLNADNNIGSAGATVFAAHARTLKALTTLYLTCKLVCTGVCCLVFVWLVMVTAYSNAFFLANNLGCDGVRALCPVFSCLTSLSTLGLSGTTI